MRYLPLLLICAWPAWAQVEMRIFQLSNRPAAATLEMVRQVLTPGGTVLAEERLNKLIVRDTPEGLQRVAALLQQIDQPAPQVRIQVNFQGGSPSSGYNLGVGGSQRGAAGGVNSYTTDSSVSASQNLLVMSGEKGRIMVGRDLVTVAPYWTYANNLGLVPPGLPIFQTVSTGFEVEPIVVGDNIRLRVTPYISYQSPNGPGQISFAESASTLNVHSGDTVMLSSGTTTRSGSTSGVSAQGGQVYSNNRSPLNAFNLILGESGGTQTQAMAISLTARIQDY